MVLRIEYLLITVSLILIFSIIGINPSSQSAIKSDGTREILFENFSLFEVKEESLGNKISASEAIKYKTHFDFKDINLSDANGDKIVATRATYKDRAVYMESNITITAQNGLLFSTENINYQLSRKVLKSETPFTLDFNGSRIEGKNLVYSMKSKEISADNIHASISFVSKED
jgi:LPS export ABC transporter protein LptC